MSGTILITGANRGIGLEFVRQYARADWRVIATCRSGMKDLEKLTDVWGNVEVMALDIACSESIIDLAHKIGEQPVDILCNNAGAGDTNTSQQFGDIDFHEAGMLFNVNTLAPLKLVEVLLENIASSTHKTIAMISSDMGSIDLNDSGGSYLYRASKAALNAVTKTLSVDLSSREIKAVALHPGSVKTRMGGYEAAAISPEISVNGMKSLLDNLTMDNSGSFLSYDNSKLPW